MKIMKKIISKIKFFKQSSLVILFFFFTAQNFYTQTIDEKLKQSSMLNVPTISVTLGGDFPINGTYPAIVNERVDEFVTRMYAQAADLILNITNDPDLYRLGKEELRRFALRGIKLKRATGEELLIDLRKFRISGDFDNNPYLKNDDVIVFPPYDIGRNFFSVSGAVNNPGLFYYVDGDRLSDAIELVRGVNPAYEHVDSVEVIRLSYDGETQTKFRVSVSDDIPLERGDQLRVLAPETQKRNYKVLVLGEVKYPGTIAITKNSTTLYQVMQQVGGFTENASLKRARLYTGNSLSIVLEKQYGISLNEQPDLEDREFRNLIVNMETIMMYRMSNVYPEDSTYFFLENKLRVLTEGSSLDFTKIENPNSDISQYIVKNNDVIVIPEIQNSVYVFGQVPRPGHVTFIEGKDYTYYLKEAGGLGSLAEEDEIMVIKGGSRAWISPIENEVVMEEGDYLYVPKQNLRTFRSYAVEYSIFVSLLASISAILLSIVTIVNK